MVCCATTLLVILVSANITLALGALLDFWPLIVVGVLLLAAGIYYYLKWRRTHLTKS